MTPKMIVLELARKAWRDGEITKEQLKKKSSNDRAYFRTIQLLEGFETQGVQIDRKEFCKAKGIK